MHLTGLHDLLCRFASPAKRRRIVRRVAHAERIGTRARWGDRHLVVFLAMPTHGVHLHLRLSTGGPHVPIKDVAARCRARTAVGAIPCDNFILVVIIVILLRERHMLGTAPPRR